MKKTLRSLLAIMIAAFTLASCSDVPSPYGLLFDDSGELEGAEGTGTLEDPFNVPAAINFIKKMEAGVSSDQTFYIKGIVSQLVEGQNYDAGFGNGTFYISVDGNAKNQFYVYRALYLENKSYTSGPIANLGDEVIICGKVVLHGGTTPETVEKEAYLYSINGETKYEVREFGTKEQPLTVAEALQIINSLENGETIGNGYVKGKVSTAPSALSAGKLTYYISGDGTTGTQLQVYKGLGLNQEKFTALTDLAVGDEVVIYGPLTKYTNGNPEINDGNYLISLTKGSSGGGGGSGSNLLQNGDFESWTNNLPDNWKSASTAGNATLTQSTDAHGGSYAVSIGFTASQAKRMAYKETKLKAGTYTFSYYAKKTTGDPSQTRAGWVPVTDGTVGSYKQGSWVTLSNTEWTEANVTFILAEETTVCLLVYNPKTEGSYSTAQNILVDDATLTTSDGGLADGESGGDEQPSGSNYTLATNFAAGKYVVAANNSGTYEVLVPLAKTYGYPSKADVTPSGNTISTDATNEFTFTATTGGYTIQDANGKYYYMTGTYNSFNVSETVPTEGHVWTVTMNSDNTVTIKNVLKGKTIRYSISHTSYGAYDAESTDYVLPSLFKKQ